MVIIVDSSGRPSFVLDARHFLRDSLFNAVSVEPVIHWHRPIVVTNMRAPLGSVIGHMKVKPEHPEDDVIDNDLILVLGRTKTHNNWSRSFGQARGAFQSITRKQPEFSELFMADLLSRNSRIEEDLIDQLFNSSEKRLARVLLLLAISARKPRSSRSSGILVRRPSPK